MEVLLILSILPSIIISFLIYKADRKEKEPIIELIKAFFLGVLSIIITLLISFIIGVDKIDIFDMKLKDILIYAFLSIALVEEFSKWICGYFFLKNNRNYDYLFDGIVYFVFISIGFATVENILYAFTTNLTTVVIRAITTVPAHAFFGVFCGYYFSIYKNKKEIKYLLLSILVPIILHGFFDFCLLTQNSIYFMMYIFFVVGLYTSSISYIKKMMLIDTSFKDKEE